MNEELNQALASCLFITLTLTITHVPGVTHVLISHLACPVSWAQWKLLTTCTGGAIQATTGNLNAKDFFDRMLH